MSVAVAAAGHHKPLAAVVQDLCLAGLDKCLGTFLVAYIDIFTVFHGECFYSLIVFGSENFTIDHEVCTGLY